MKGLNLQKKVDKVVGDIDATEGYSRREIMVFTGTSVPDGANGENYSITFAIQSWLSNITAATLSWSFAAGTLNIKLYPADVNPTEKTFLASESLTSGWSTILYVYEK